MIKLILILEAFLLEKYMILFQLKEIFETLDSAVIMAKGYFE
jgi:hypothetical protein